MCLRQIVRRNFRLFPRFRSLSLLLQILHWWLLPRGSVLHNVFILRCHLLILLYQRAATTEAGGKAVVTAVALDIVLAAHVAPADSLADTLKTADGEGAPAYTLTARGVSISVFIEKKRRKVHCSYKTKHRVCHPYKLAFYHKEYMDTT